MAKVYLALVHYPVYNKRMDVVATAVTNLDVHDIARSSCTYGIAHLFTQTGFQALAGLHDRL